jgi:hypothetical protein
LNDEALSNQQSAISRQDVFQYSLSEGQRSLRKRRIISEGHGFSRAEPSLLLV